MYVDAPLSTSQIQEYRDRGIRIRQDQWVPPVPGKHPHGFYLAEVDYSSLNFIQNDPTIARLESTELAAEPMNNNGASFINVDDVRDGSGVMTARDGTGVNIAIADSGIDLTHTDFPVPAEAYDVTDGVGVGAWGTNVTNTVTDHGTHVAGSVLGRGTLSAGNVGNGGGAYQGSAPGANLYFYKIGNDTTSSASYSDMIEAINRALLVGCDIFSMSYGGISDYVDGSASVCQAVDNAVANGMTIFVSAGNEGDDDEHYSESVIPGATTAMIAYTINNTDASPYTDIEWIQVNWRDDAPSTENIVLSCSNLGAGESLLDAAYGTSARSTEGKIYLLIPNVSGSSSKTYQFQIANTAGSGSTPLVHLYSTVGQGTFDSPDSGYTVGAPALADSAIAVGAWVHRKFWTNFQGSTYNFTSNTQNTLAPFSSRGPRIDGVLKPDIVAPGAVVISTRDSSFSNSAPFVVDNDGATLNGSGPANYYAKQGTSMACPLAAGAAALLVEEDGSLTPSEIYTYLTTTASNSGSPNSSVGYGMINMVEALGSLPTPTPTETATETPTSTPTFTDTATPTATETFTATSTETPTFTMAPTDTFTNTPTETHTPTSTPSFTFSNTPTETPTHSPTETPIPPTDTLTPTQTLTETSTPTATWTPSPSWTSTPTITFSSTPTVTDTRTPTSTPTFTPFGPPTSTPTPSHTATPVFTPTPTERSSSVENWELY